MQFKLVFILTLAQRSLYSFYCLENAGFAKWIKFNLRLPTGTGWKEEELFAFIT